MEKNKTEKCEWWNFSWFNGQKIRKRADDYRCSYHDHGLFWNEGELGFRYYSRPADELELGCTH